MCVCVFNGARDRRILLANFNTRCDLYCILVSVSGASDWNKLHATRQQEWQAGSRREGDSGVGHTSGGHLLDTP